jgi:hypothetical protein
MISQPHSCQESPEILTQIEPVGSRKKTIYEDREKTNIRKKLTSPQSNLGMAKSPI